MLFNSTLERPSVTRCSLTTPRSGLRGTLRRGSKSGMTDTTIVSCVTRSPPKHTSVRPRMRKTCGGSAFLEPSIGATGLARGQWHRRRTPRLASAPLRGGARKRHRWCLRCLRSGGIQHFTWDPKHLKFWCNLCGKYGSDSHVASASHRNRAEWPTSYGFNVPHPAIASQPQQQSPPPPQPPLERRVTEWQAHWDAKSGRHSFICARTGERRFHMPERVPYFEIF